MAEPTLVMTFSDFQIRVAEFLGCAYYGAAGDEAAQVPTDAHNLDLVKRLANDGYRRFINANPTWNFLTPTFTITTSAGESGTADSGTSTTLVDSDLDDDDDYYNGWYIRVKAGTGNGEYALVTDFTSSTGTVTFSGGLSGSSTPDTTSEYELAPSQCVRGDTMLYWMPDGFYGQMIDWFTFEEGDGYVYTEKVPDVTIRDLNSATGHITGIPSKQSLFPFNDSDAPKWATRLWPDPADTYILTGRCRLFPDALSSGADTPVCGFAYNDAVLASCLAVAEEYKDDGSKDAAERWREALVLAIRQDRQTVPSNLGYNGDGSDGYYRTRRPWYNGVDTYTNIDRTVHSF